ncbi:MAG: apolipoprotein N-acyltransferase [Acidobacteria bacterium]|nr:MAG: apolipoprotein N-acyltransferase [Acidobacteriota bacterium]
MTPAGRRALRAAAAPLAGAGLALAFPRPGWSALAVPSLAVLFALAGSARPRRAAAEGFAGGFVFFSLLLRWFAAVILEHTPLGGGAAAGAVLASGALLAAGWAAAAWLAARTGPGAALASAAILWVAYERLREAVPAPFPWGVLAAAFAGSAPGRVLARSVGSAGISLLAASLAAVLASFLLRRPRRFAAALGWGAVALAAAAAGLALPAGQRERARVAVVQGAVPAEAAAVEKFEVYAGLTRRAAARGARLVVWPESATGLRIDADRAYRRAVERLAAETGTDILLGSVTGRGSRWFNSAVLVRADVGMATVSAKRVLVPFGEYLPLRPLLGEVPALAAEAGDFSPGASAVLHPARVGRIGALVCYEAVFPGLALEFAREGASFLANLTNDTWFGWTSGPFQHLAHAVLRAPETGRPLLRAANGGISVIVDADGTVEGRLGLGERGVIVADVAPGGGAPVGAAVGRAVAWACVILSFALLVSGVRHDRSGPPRRAPAGLPERPGHPPERPDTAPDGCEHA